MISLNELMQSRALFFSIISVVVATIVFVIYFVVKGRRQEREEDNEIVYSLVDAQQKELEDVVEEVKEDKREMKEVVEDKIEKRSNPVETLDIENMLKQMQKDLEAKGEDVVATFEQEQEENSIISYQELVKSLERKKDHIQTIEEIENKVSIVEEKPQVEQFSMDDTLKAPEKRVQKKFKNTDFISPIYGKMEEHLEYPTVPPFHKEDKEIEQELELYSSISTNKNIDDFLDDFDFDSSIEVNSLEQTLDMKPLSEEIKRNDEFLQALKEFRKNLD